MSDLAFIDKLDQEQLNNLGTLLKYADEIGVDRRLAASVAYAESELRQTKGKEPVKSKRGAIGIMQVMPGTAAMLNYSPEDLLRPEANMEAGLTFLKQNIERFGDPRLGLIAYNAGPNHPFFETKGEKSPPKESLEYVSKVQSYGGFDPEDHQEPQNEPEAPPEAQKAPTVTPASEDDFRTLKAAGMGAGAGAAFGTVAKSSQFLSNVAKSAAQAAAAQAAAMQNPQGAQTAGEKWAQKVTGHVKPGVQTVTEAAQDYRRAMPQGKISGQIANRFGPPPPVQPGVFTGGQLANPKPPVPLPPPPPPPTFSQKAGQALNRFSGAMARSPITTGALAGAGIAGGVQEAMTRYPNDKIGSAIAGAGAVGSGLAAIPTLPTRVIGGGMAMASPAALMVLDKMRNPPSKQQSIGAMSNVDAMGNPLP